MECDLRKLAHGTICRNAVAPSLVIPFISFTIDFLLHFSLEIKIECNKYINNMMLVAWERQDKILLATWNDMSVCVYIFVCFF